MLLTQLALGQERTPLPPTTRGALTLTQRGPHWGGPGATLLQADPSAAVTQEGNGGLPRGVHAPLTLTGFLKAAHEEARTTPEWRKPPPKEGRKAHES